LRNLTSAPLFLRTLPLGTSAALLLPILALPLLQLPLLPLLPPLSVASSKSSRQMGQLTEAY
jgi:hypothetical protein